MLQEFVAVIQGIGHTLTKGLPISIALGLVFTALSFLWACNPGQVWWRKRDLWRPCPVGAGTADHRDHSL